MKSIEEIMENIQKSYCKHAHLLMKHLFRKAVPDRISWDEHGIVIDGNVVKDSNISDLINDAMRERKIMKVVGKNQFALLLRTLNIPSTLMRNKRLLSTRGDSINSVKLRSQASSTPIVLRARGKRKT